MMLFYSKIVPDTIGRPLTLICAPRCFQSPKGLLVGAFCRLCFVPVFFAYTYISADWMYRNDAMICACVALFSMLSGYFNTLAYSIAPSLVTQREATTAANALNLAFHLAVYLALSVSIVVHYALDEDSL